MANFKEIFEQYHLFVGTSTDTKPTSCPNGSKCLETNTSKLFITNDGGVTWDEINPKNHRNTVLTTKTIVDGAHSIDDVVCEDAVNGEGTDWDFDFGGTGYITKAIIVCAKTALTSVMELQLFSAPPTCELDDNAAGVTPVAADVPYFIGSINFPAMKDVGTGHSFAVTVPGEGSGLPMAFDATKLYGVLIDKTGTDFDASLMSILLTADMDD